jgi:hypothetical protein
MPEISQYDFKLKEIVELLVKKLDLHEGVWGLRVRFGLKAMNVGADDTDLHPAAIVPLLEIGIQKFDKPNNMAVDAAVANPAPRSKKRTKKIPK